MSNEYSLQMSFVLRNKNYYEEKQSFSEATSIIDDATNLWLMDFRVGGRYLLWLPMKYKCGVC